MALVYAPVFVSLGLNSVYEVSDLGEFLTNVLISNECVQHYLLTIAVFGNEIQSWRENPHIGDLRR